MKRHVRFTRACVSAAAVCLVAVGCAAGSEGANPERADPASTSPAPTQSTTAPEPEEEYVDIVAVADVACDPTSPVFHDPQYCRHEEVARLTKKLVRQGAEWFIVPGDIQYEDATLAKFNQVYDKYFGKLKSITKPVPGNHEYYTEGASGYFDYFGKKIAGTPQKPWSSFSPVDDWRIFLLDSNCEFVDGCGPDSPQGRWLTKELKASDESCSIAVWHHPLHTSGGYNGDQPTIDRAQPLWDATDAGGVDVVLVGHDHIYERFAPIDGMTQFTVGMGGKELYEIGPPAPKSKVRIGDRTGVLRMTLSSEGRYEYAMIDASNGKVVDGGKQRCVNSPKK